MFNHVIVWKFDNEFPSVETLYFENKATQLLYFELPIIL